MQRDEPRRRTLDSFRKMMSVKHFLTLQPPWVTWGSYSPTPLSDRRIRPLSGHFLRRSVKVKKQDGSWCSSITLRYEAKKQNKAILILKVSHSRLDDPTLGKTRPTTEKLCLLNSRLQTFRYQKILFFFLLLLLWLLYTLHCTVSEEQSVEEFG